MLHVDVSPSSSNSSPSVHSINSFSNRGASYEEVDCNELEFPDYYKVKRLGRGSYGTVLRATWRNKQVAAKMVETDIDHKTIHNEAKLLHELVHPNIIKLYAVFKGEQMGLILELMEGGSLHELLHQNKHIKYYTEHVFSWAHQCASAIKYLHGKELVHRDLKPSNMLLTNDYLRLKLCDFGTAAELKTSMTNNRGTAAWMAPEVFRGRKYDQKCDIFSFGVFMWEMLARRQPFTDSDSHAYTILWQVAEGRRPPDIDKCPEAFMDFIKRCWEDEPGKRPCIDEVVEIIELISEIYWNYDKPLIDLTTDEQAFAHVSEHSSVHSTLYDSGYMTKITKNITPSAPMENWVDDSQQTIKPPVPPRPAPPVNHHRRSGSDHTYTQVPAYPAQMPTLLPPIQMFDPRAMNGSRSLSNMTVVTTVSPNPPGFQPIPPPSYQPPQPTPPGSLRGVPGASPQGRPSIPTIYAPQISTPVPNAMPYSPCLSTTNNITPPAPPYYHSTSIPAAATNSALTSQQNEIGWRRASEPPCDTTSLGGTSNSEKKKKSPIQKFFSGVKKEFKEVAKNKI